VPLRPSVLLLFDSWKLSHSNKNSLGGLSGLPRDTGPVVERGVPFHLLLPPGRAFGLPNY
jgi:hypothetical protein